jgi:outer membrane protein insertion porin family
MLFLAAGCDSQARITGTQHVSAAQLEEAARRPLTSWQQQQRNADLVDAAAAMHDRLDALGYVWAVVDGLPPEAVDEPALPRFTVNEGPRVKVGEITWNGDLALSREALTELAHFGSWLTTADIDEAPRRITRGLRQAGHLLATVAPVNIQWNAARDVAQIHLTVSAGPRFKVAEEKIEMIGEQSLRPQLIALLDAPGTIAHPRLASEVAARIRGFLFNLGYRQTTVESTTHVDEALATMVVTVVINTGTRQTVSGISIVGGRRTSRAFIEREMRDLAPGQPLSQAALDRAVSSLALTGLYRRVQSDVIPGPPAADGSVPTEVRLLLKENPTQRVDLSVGYGSYEQLRGGVEYIDEHIFGRGLRFNTGVNASFKGWGYDAGIQDPYLLGPGRRVGLDVEYSEREEPSFSHHETGATLSVTQKAQPRFDPVPYQVRSTYAFKRAEDFAIGAPLPGQEQAGEYTTSAIGLNLSRDSRRPKIIDPDSGTYAQIGSQLSAKPLGAEVEFIELSASYFAAVNPAPWLVATINLAAITRDPYNGESLPIGERLFLGGEDTVRSFTKDDLGPRDADGTPIGGLTRAVGNVELRWRLFAEHRAFEIATFYDLGLVSEDPWSLNGSTGQALGLGLRYRTPVGPIRLDGAYNPGNRLGAEHPYAIHLAVGFAF